MFDARLSLHSPSDLEAPQRLELGINACALLRTLHVSAMGHCLL